MPSIRGMSTDNTDKQKTNKQAKKGCCPKIRGALARIFVVFVRISALGKSRGGGGMLQPPPRTLMHGCAFYRHVSRNVELYEIMDVCARPQICTQRHTHTHTHTHTQQTCALQRTRTYTYLNAFAWCTHAQKYFSCTICVLTDTLLFGNIKIFVPSEKHESKLSWDCLSTAWKSFFPLQ